MHREPHVAEGQDKGKSLDSSCRKIADVSNKALSRSPSASFVEGSAEDLAETKSSQAISLSLDDLDSETDLFELRDIAIIENGIENHEGVPSELLNQMMMDESAFRRAFRCIPELRCYSSSKGPCYHLAKIALLQALAPGCSFLTDLKKDREETGWNEELTWCRERVFYEIKKTYPALSMKEAFDKAFVVFAEEKLGLGALSQTLKELLEKDHEFLYGLSLYFATKEKEDWELLLELVGSEEICYSILSRYAQEDPIEPIKSDSPENLAENPDFSERSETSPFSLAIDENFSSKSSSRMSPEGDQNLFESTESEPINSISSDSPENLADNSASFERSETSAASLTTNESFSSKSSSRISLEDRQSPSESFSADSDETSIQMEQKEEKKNYLQHRYRFLRSSVEIMPSQYTLSDLDDHLDFLEMISRGVNDRKSISQEQLEGLLHRILTDKSFLKLVLGAIGELKFYEDSQGPCHSLIKIALLEALAPESSFLKDLKKEREKAGWDEELRWCKEKVINQMQKSYPACSVKEAFDKAFDSFSSKDKLGLGALSWHLKELIQKDYEFLQALSWCLASESKSDREVLQELLGFSSFKEVFCTVLLSEIGTGGSAQLRAAFQKIVEAWELSSEEVDNLMKEIMEDSSYMERLVQKICGADFQQIGPEFFPSFIKRNLEDDPEKSEKMKKEAWEDVISIVKDGLFDRAEQGNLYGLRKTDEDLLDSFYDLPGTRKELWSLLKEENSFWEELYECNSTALEAQIDAGWGLYGAHAASLSDTASFLKTVKQPGDNESSKDRPSSHSSSKKSMR
jgi:hypothetical protein